MVLLFGGYRGLGRLIRILAEGVSRLRRPHDGEEVHHRLRDEDVAVRAGGQDDMVEIHVDEQALVLAHLDDLAEVAGIGPEVLRAVDDALEDALAFVETGGKLP